MLLDQVQRGVERLVRAGAGRKALHADARVRQVVGRAEPGRRQVPRRATAPAVGGPEAVAVLEGARVGGEAGLGEERGLHAAPGGVPGVQRLAVGPEVRLDPLARDAAMASA